MEPSSGTSGGGRERKTGKRTPGEMPILQQLAINQPGRQFRPVPLQLTADDGELLQLVERPIDMDEVRQRQLEFQELETDIAELSMIPSPFFLVYFYAPL